jgi:hypothetical protein
MAIKKCWSCDICNAIYPDKSKAKPACLQGLHPDPPFQVGEKATLDSEDNDTHEIEVLEVGHPQKGTHSRKVRYRFITGPLAFEGYEISFLFPPPTSN